MTWRFATEPRSSGPAASLSPCDAEVVLNRFVGWPGEIDAQPTRSSAEELAP